MSHDTTPDELLPLPPATLHILHSDSFKRAVREALHSVITVLSLRGRLFQQVDPGQQGAGVLRQGFLEASNVEPVHQLIDLITTQRSFELNSRAIQAGDQILQLISNLGRV